MNSPDRHDHAAAPSRTATRSRGSDAATVRWPRTRRGFAATAVVVVTTLGLAAAQMSVSPAQASPGDGPVDFSSSFETGQPQPTWTSTLETDSKGVTKAWGVTTRPLWVPFISARQWTGFAMLLWHLISLYWMLFLPPRPRTSARPALTKFCPKTSRLE